MSRLRWTALTVILSLCALASPALGQTVSFLDEDGAATAVYAEGSRAVVRVEDPAANVSPAADTVQVQLTSSRAGDAETLTLTETGPATGVFRGEIKLAPGNASQPGMLETAVNPDPPFDRDTIQASYGAATATATMAGSKVMFLDRYGRPTTHLVGGQPIRMRVIEPLANFNSQYLDYTGVSLSTPSGDGELLYLQETGTDTGIFEGEMPSRVGSPVSGDQVLEEVSVGATVTGEVPDFDVPTITRVTATLGSDHVELVDAQGKAADFYLESTRVYLEVTGPAGSPSVAAQMTADLSGDSEAVTLQETGAGTGIYRGSIAMRRGPALPGNGLLETTESGPPYRFDTVRVTYGSTGSADAVQTIGSLTSFHDAFGNEVSAYAAGAPVTVRVEDHNFNNPAAIDSVQATVQSLSTGDAESLTLYETGRDTGLFEATVPTAGNGAPSPNDGRLQVSPGETIQAMHVDAFPQLASGALAHIDVLSIHFLDEKGRPTTELLEGGMVRVQVVSPSYNGIPHQVETLGITLQARFSGDQETLQLTETGPDTGVFEGSIPTAFAYPILAPGDGTLQFLNGPGLPEEVTATLDGATAVAHSVGSRLMFVDEFGRETTTVPFGGPVRLRVVGPAYNFYPDIQDYMDVQLTVAGDSEYVTVTETGVGTGIFEGSIGSTGGAQAANDGSLESAAGQSITATLWSAYGSPDVHTQAVFTSGQVTFVDETGAPASVYLEGTQARVRVVDHGADLHSFADTVTVNLTTEISGDQESLTLTETGPQTGVFEGTILVRHGPVLPNSGAIEPGEEAGPPHAFDIIHASYTAAGNGGISTATAGTQNYRLWLIDAYGQVTSHYAERSRVYVRLEDHRDGDPGAFDRAHVIVTSATGDQEPLELVETGRATGIYEGSLSLDSGASPAADGQLQAGPGTVVSAVHDTGFTADPPYAVIDSLSVAFIDETGHPTAKLLEGDLVRVRVVSASGNLNPNQAETLTVSLQTLYGGDQENLQLTETGPDTGVFEGSIPSAFAYPPGSSGDGALQFLHGFPENSPEEVTVFAGDVKAVAHAVGARLTFVDEYGRETTAVPLGGKVRLRVVGPGYNFYPDIRDSMDVQLTVAGDSEYVTVTETGFATGVFEGSIDSTGGAQAANNGRLESAVGQSITATLWSPYGSPDVHTQAVFTGGQVAFVDEAGNAATTYLEGTRARVRVVDHGADLHASADTVTVTLTTEISGDRETLTLTETGPQTGVFEGAIQLRNGPVLQNSGAIEPGEEAGPPHAFDVIHASYTAANGGGGATAAIGLLNFRVWFIDAYGQVTDRYAERSRAYVRVEDHRNGDPGAIDRTYAVVASATGDREALELVETGPATSIFEGSLPLDSSGSPAADGRLLAGPGDAITAAPSTGYTAEPARARIGSLSVVFLDETGNPTVELLEGGLVRVRVVGASSNLDPTQAETLTATLQTRYAGDQETLQLTETGPDTGVFEGAVPTAFVYPPGASGDGTLQFSNSGGPASGPEEVTAFAGDATAVAHAVGSRLMFVDDQGHETTTVPLGSPVRLRVVGPAFNFYPDLQDSMDVELTVGGDDEFVMVNETGLDTGIFEGTIDSLEGSPAVRNGILESAVGQTITASLWSAYGSPNVEKQAVFGSPASGASIAFLNLRGQLVTTYSLRAPVNVRITDPGQAGNGPLTVSLQSLANGDTETLSAVETSPGVFVGSLPSTDADGGTSGDGTLTVGAEQVAEARYGTVTARVTFSSNQPPLAVEDAARTLKNRSSKIFVMANDVDPEGMQLTIASVTPGAHGSVVIDPEGSVTYKPAQDYSGTDTFTYLVVDPLGGESVGTVTVTLDNKDNSNPVAVDDHVNVSPGARVSISPMLNDYDPDGDPLTLSAQKPAHGTLTDLFSFVSYLPDPGFTGTDSFTYQINDNWGGFATGTVFITVAPNHPPVANDDFARTGVGQPAILKVLANDTDPDGDPLSLSSTTQGAHGATGIFDSGTLGYTPFPGFTGDDTFTYTMTDGRGGSATATVRVTVGLANRPPVANNDSGETNQGGSATVNVLANDTDPDGDPLTVTAADGVINPDKTVTFTPAPTAVGATPFSYTISDGQGGTATGTVTILVNVPPVANPDAVTVMEDFSIDVAVLANDTDANGDFMVVTGVTQGLHGTVSINWEGTVHYSPARDYNGPDSFTYTVSDGKLTATGTVTVTVTPTNDVPETNPDSATVPEDGSVEIHVLSNDTDVDNDILHVASVTQGAHGTVSINSSRGTVIYTPAANYNGPDSFTYMAADNSQAMSLGTVTVTVTPVNDAPVAVADSATVAENGTVDVAVLGNDTDVDNDTLAVASVTQGAHGAVAINANGTVRYKPAANYSGPDAFTYTVSDGHGGTATGTVAVTVIPANRPPVANADSATVAEDGTAGVAVLDNDTDPDNDSLSLTSVTQGAHGAVAINANGTVTYTPAANYNGPDSFTYTVSDGQGHTATGTVAITVTPVNDPPVANADTATVFEDLPTTVTVLSNDTDIDNDTLTVVSVTQGAHGAVSLNADGTLRYLGALNYNGPDSFTYTVSDGHGGTATATVSITVTPVDDAPVANPDTATVIEDGAVDIAVLANDTDVENDPLSLVSVTQGAHGAVAKNADGTVRYTPAADYSGSDSFTYTVSDSHKESTGRVTVTVAPVNDPPVANPDFTTTFEDTPATEIPIMANDRDPDGDVLSLTVTQPAHGTVVIDSIIRDSIRTVTYTPAPNFNGQDSFTYTISDGHGGSATATVTVTVLPVNDNPTAVDDTATVPEDGAVTIDVLANDITVTNQSSPAHGTVTINADNTLTYQPAPNYHGADSFTYYIADSNRGFGQAQVFLTVTSVNDPPVAFSYSFFASEDQASNYNVLEESRDVDGDVLTVIAVTQGTHGVTAINPDKTVKSTPPTTTARIRSPTRSRTATAARRRGRFRSTSVR
jgi:VCBS repeat-containing protein